MRRTLFETRQRAGQLEGNIDRLSWRLIRFILFEQPKKRARDTAILRASGLPLLELASMRELAQLYRAWGLERRPVDERGAVGRANAPGGLKPPGIGACGPPGKRRGRDFVPVPVVRRN